jgi:hypothetical protein
VADPYDGGMSGMTGDTPPSMDPVLAVVWHYWIAVPLAIGAVLLALAVVAGYLKRVQSAKYPRQ